jgi:peptidyl-prolyl cis-trans isomerase SurA
VIATGLGAGGASAQDVLDPGRAVEVVDRIVAVVGDEIVLLSEVDEEVYLAGLRGELSLRDTEAVQVRRREILDGLVEAKILLEEARRQGIRVEREETERALESTLDDVRRRFPTEEAFEAQLRLEGVSLDQLRVGQRAKIEEQLMVRQLVDRAVRSKVLVEEREVRAYWEEHRAEIPRLPAHLDLRRILVSVDASAEVDSAAIRRAEIVRARLDAGEDFATLARVFSEGPGAEAGGDVGWFRPADLDSAVAAALAGLPAGGTTGVVVSGRGAQILRVEEVDPQRGMRLRQIVFLRDRSAALARARARAEAVRARLSAGEPFEAVAREESDDAATAADGGRVGLVPLESLEDRYRSVLEGTQPGGITGLVEDDEGFSIFRVEGRQGERDATFEDVRDRLEEMVRARKGRELYEELLASARGKTYVETRLDDDRES